MTKTTTISLRMENDTLENLKNAARKISYEKESDMTYVDLIREAVEKTYDIDVSLEKDLKEIIINDGFYDDEIEQKFLKTKTGKILQKCIETDNYSEFCIFAKDIMDNNIKNSLATKLLKRTKGVNGFCQIDRDPASIAYVLNNSGAKPEAVSGGDSLIIPKFDLGSNPSIRTNDITPVRLFSCALKTSLAFEKELSSQIINCALCAATSRTENNNTDNLNRKSLLIGCRQILQHDLNVSSIVMNPFSYIEIIDQKLVENANLNKNHYGTFMGIPILVTTRIQIDNVLFFGPKDIVGRFFYPNQPSFKHLSKPEKLKESFVASIQAGIGITNDWAISLLKVKQ